MTLQAMAPVSVWEAGRLKGSRPRVAASQTVVWCVSHAFLLLGSDGPSYSVCLGGRIHAMIAAGAHRGMDFA